MRQRWTVATVLLLVAGLALWIWTASDTHQTPLQWAAVAAAAIAAFIPPIRRPISHALQILRRPTRRPPYLTAAIIGIAATLYLTFIAVHANRALVPHGHDDQEILLQTRLLSTGHLWLPSHPLPDFFQTFHVFSRPVYAPIHFPGAAMMLLPWAWLGLPFIAMPLLISGACVAMTFLFVTELTDRLGGLLAAILLLSVSEFRYLSILNLTNLPAMLLALACTFAYLRWRTTRRTPWLALLGATAGWLIITRPPDAAMLGLPLAIAFLLDRPRGLRPWAALLLPAIPFIALHLVFNLGVTGHLLMTPHQYYTRTHFPQNTWGLGGSPAPLPAVEPTFSEMQAYVAEFYDQGSREYHDRGPLREGADRLRQALAAGACHPLILLLAPLSLLTLTRRRWIILAVIPLYVAIYALAPVFLLSYATLTFPALALAAVLGARALRSLGQIPNTLALLTLTAAAITSLPPLDPSLDERGYGPEPFTLMELVFKKFPADLPTPALVFFKWSPGINVHEDPIYNLASAHIDDNPLIKARDLGPQRDMELIHYYAQHQPTREIFLFDRTTTPPTLTRSGRAGDLAK